MKDCNEQTIILENSYENENSLNINNASENDVKKRDACKIVYSKLNFNIKR